MSHLLGKASTYPSPSCSFFLVPVSQRIGKQGGTHVGTQARHGAAAFPLHHSSMKERGEKQDQMCQSLLLGTHKDLAGDLSSTSLFPWSITCSTCSCLLPDAGAAWGNWGKVGHELPPRAAVLWGEVQVMEIEMQILLSGEKAPINQE